LPINDRFERA